MRINPNTARTGRVISGDTPYGVYRFVIEHDYDGPMFDAEGKQLGTLMMEIREPENQGVSPKATEPLNLTQPGDLLAYTIKKLYGQTEEQATRPGGAGCDCEKIRREMNQHGWAWCVAHRKELMARVVASAAKKNIIIEGDDIWQMLASAWKQRKETA